MKQWIQRNTLWVVVIVVVVIGGLVWLGTSNNEDKNTSSSSSSSSMNQSLYNTCMTDVNDKTFCKFAGSFGNVEAFRVDANIETESGSSKMVLLSDKNDNSQMIYSLNGQEQGNVVYYNGTTYSKDYTDGKWLAYSSSDPNKPEVTDLKKEFAKGDFKNDKGQKEEYVNIGTETVNGFKCYKYQVKDPAKPEQIGYIWFDTSQYLLRQLSIKDGTSSTLMTVTYPTVNITQPTPTKTS